MGRDSKSFKNSPYIQAGRADRRSFLVTMLPVSTFKLKEVAQLNLHVLQNSNIRFIA